MLFVNFTLELLGIQTPAHNMMKLLEADILNRGPVPVARLKQQRESKQRQQQQQLSKGVVVVWGIRKVATSK